MFPGRVPTPRFYTEWIRGGPGNAHWYPSHSYLGPAPWPCPARGLLPRRDHGLSGTGTRNLPNTGCFSGGGRERLNG